MEHSVECYAAARYPERPIAFLWGGERLAVAEVERQWRTPVEIVFRVRTESGGRFDLSFCEATGKWDIRELEP
jgi:hypothetical protein